MVDEAIEIEAASEGEATQRACEALNTRLENLGYEVLERSKTRSIRNLLGGGGKIKIRAWRKDVRGEATYSPVCEKAMQTAKTIVSNIVEEFELEVREQSEQIIINIQADEGGLIIGKNGSTLDAIQYLVRRIVGRELGDRAADDKQIVIDSEGYRERRRESLIQLAQKAAGRVRKSKKRERLRPMNAYERRIVHLTIEEERGVESLSEGEGESRSVSVVPAQKKGRGKNRSSQNGARDNRVASDEKVLGVDESVPMSGGES